MEELTLKLGTVPIWSVGFVAPVFCWVMGRKKVVEFFKAWQAVDDGCSRLGALILVVLAPLWYPFWMLIEIVFIKTLAPLALFIGRKLVAIGDKLVGEVWEQRDIDLIKRHLRACLETAKLSFSEEGNEFRIHTLERYSNKAGRDIVIDVRPTTIYVKSEVGNVSYLCLEQLSNNGQEIKLRAFHDDLLAGRLYSCKHTLKEREP